MNTQHRFVVLGGAGTIGKFVVRDLFESDPDNCILIADFKEPAAQSTANAFNDPRVKSTFANARQPKELINLLQNHDVCINCLQHDFNLAIMEAALSAGVHYVDLGGLFYFTRKQLQLNEKFIKSGLTAVIGMGCSPGITNILASFAAKRLERITSIKIRVGSIDFNPPGTLLQFPYSAQTIIEELTLRPWIWDNGEFRKVSPRTGWELTSFPEPIGKIWTVLTRHSEIATLPLNFQNKGLRYCDFKVNFDREFVKEVMKRLKSGWTIQQFKNLMMPALYPNDHEIAQVMVDNLMVGCHARSKPEWHAGAGDIDTACPASIVAQMIAGGTIKQRGVLPPENAVPDQLFFLELKKRGMRIWMRPKEFRLV